MQSVTSLRFSCALLWLRMTSGDSPRAHDRSCAVAVQIVCPCSMRLLFASCWVRESSHILDTMPWKLWTLILLIVSFQEEVVFRLLKPKAFFFSSQSLRCAVLWKKSLSTTGSQRFSPISLERCIVLAFTFRSVAHSLKRTSFYHWVPVAPLMKCSCPCAWVSVQLLSSVPLMPKSTLAGPSIRSRLNAAVLLPMLS